MKNTVSLKHHEYDDMSVEEARAFTLKYDVYESLHNLTRGYGPTQQAHCYFWENRWEKTEIYTHILPLEELREINSRVLQAYGLDPSSTTVNIQFHGLDGGGTMYNGKKNTTNLSPKSACLYVLLHETSHCIMNLSGQAEDNQHSPDFVATLFDVLCRFVPGATLSYLRATADEDRLLYAGSLKSKILAGLARAGNSPITEQTS